MDELQAILLQKFLTQIDLCESLDSDFSDKLSDDLYACLLQGGDKQNHTVSCIKEVLCRYNSSMKSHRLRLEQQYTDVSSVLNSNVKKRYESLMVAMDKTADKYKHLQTVIDILDSIKCAQDNFRHIENVFKLLHDNNLQYEIVGVKQDWLLGLSNTIFQLLKSVEHNNKSLYIQVQRYSGATNYYKNEQIKLEAMKDCYKQCADCVTDITKKYRIKFSKSELCKSKFCHIEQLERVVDFVVTEQFDKHTKDTDELCNDVSIIFRTLHVMSDDISYILQNIPVTNKMYTECIAKQQNLVKVLSKFKSKVIERFIIQYLRANSIKEQASSDGSVSNNCVYMLQNTKQMCLSILDESRCKACSGYVNKENLYARINQFNPKFGKCMDMFDQMDGLHNRINGIVNARNNLKMVYKANKVIAR